MNHLSLDDIVDTLPCLRYFLKLHHVDSYEAEPMPSNLSNIRCMHAKGRQSLFPETSNATYLEAACVLIVESTFPIRQF